MGFFSRSVKREVGKSVAIVVVGIVIIWIVLLIGFGTMNPFYVVASGSMRPALEVYDVLVVQGNIPFEDVRPGDIIVFDRPSDHDRVIVHRVVSIMDDDPKTIMTKGDANRASIPGTDFPITEDEYIGKVIYTVPDVGYATQVLKPPVNYIIIAIVIGVVVMRQIRKGKKEEDSEGSEPSYDIPDMTDLKRDPEYEDTGVQDDDKPEDLPDDAGKDDDKPEDLPDDAGKDDDKPEDLPDDAGKDAGLDDKK